MRIGDRVEYSPFKEGPAHLGTVSSEPWTLRDGTKVVRLEMDEGYRKRVVFAASLNNIRKIEHAHN